MSSPDFGTPGMREWIRKEIHKIAKFLFPVASNT